MEDRWTRCPVFPALPELSLAIQADRERELRNRWPRVAGVPSGPRHPRRPDLELPRLGRQRALTPVGTGVR
jgi:hypothetical protein